MIDETPKISDRLALEKAGQMKEAERPNPRPKEGRSAFDEVLEQGRRLNQPNLNPVQENKQTQKEQSAPVEKLKERFREQNKEKENRDDTKKESKEGKRETTEGGKRVVAKEGDKNKEQESGSGGNFREGGSDKQGKRPLLNPKKGFLEVSKGMGTGVEGPKNFQNHLTPSANPLPKTFSQEILNQLVRYVRIGLNKKGQKEIQIDLHQNVFKGLALRVSADHGKVNLHFLTADRGVQALFEREKPAIQEALRQKGIAVGEIRVH